MNGYGKLARLCEILRALLYTNGDIDAAAAYLPELRCLLDELPRDDTAIVVAEGHSLYYELTGNISQALASRLREVDLMGQLYSDIRKNNYDEITKRTLLTGRDEAALSMRRAIIRSLRQKLKEAD